jgi:hypothetical protein
MGQPPPRIRGNLVVRDAEGEATASYRVHPRPASELLAAALDAAGDARFSLLWVTRRWSFDRYAIGTEATADVRHSHRAALTEYLDGQRRQLAERDIPGTPEVYLCIRLAGARAPDELVAERRVRQRLLPWLGCERASEADLRWLGQRARGTHHAFLSLEVAPQGEASRAAAIGQLLAPLEVAGCPVDVALSASRATADHSDGTSTLDAVLSLCVAASSPEEVERRIELLRRELAPVALRRVAGEWLARRARISSRRLAAMLPRPIPKLGTEVGPYIGHRVDGSPRAVRFDSGEASRGSSPWVLIAGAAGSGKTLLLQMIMFQAFLTGAVLCDVDLGGDHVLHRLPEAREHARVVELTGGPSQRGVLDPLTIAPTAVREELACSVLLGLLADASRAEWHTALRLAVAAVAARGGRCGEVIDELAVAPAPGPDVADALAERAGSGPALIALGVEAMDSAEPTPPQLAVLRLPGVVPLRLRRTLGKLLALYALRLTARDPGRQVVLGLDGADLLSDRTGRAVVRHVARLGRARPVTALLTTRVPDGAERVAEIGTAFYLGDRGRCVMRDHAGRSGEVQIEVANTELAAALGIRPTPPKGGAGSATLNLKRR